jgi:hypothetical protein
MCGSLDAESGDSTMDPVPLVAGGLLSSFANPARL